jgi:two-component system chemotaxis response regulator CheV
MSNLLKNIDARTKLAGTNKLEILLFTLGTDQRTGRRETFGINVFKVREVMRVPEITHAPDMPSNVEGMLSLRGSLVPVVNLAKYAGIETDKKPEIMIVTEYNRRMQGFLVEAVDTILRLDWSDMKVPPEMVSAQMGGLVTAVTELKDGRIVMMIDVEKILSETTHYDDESVFSTIRAMPSLSSKTVLFADDSTVARKQVEKTLNALGVKHISAINGRQAWEELQRIASRCDAIHELVNTEVSLILTDVEMPEMDGYVLTKNVKSDPRFSGIPVIMYSSLSSVNQHLGAQVGVDEYVSKLQPQKLAETIARRLEQA